MRTRAFHGALLALASAAAPSVAAAHALAPSVLELREGAAGRVDVLWRTPRLAVRGAQVEPVLPARCSPLRGASTQADDAMLTVRGAIECGPSGLLGAELAARGLALSRTSVLIRVVRPDGSALRSLLSERAPRWVVPPAERATTVLLEHARAGALHLAGGIDHLLFVGGLLLLLGTLGRVALALSAFTLGHAATLSLTTLEGFVLPAGPVEVAIALSLVLVALEAAMLASGARPGPSPSRAGRLGRRPVLLSFGFGLVHGLGFAGALLAAGLPRDALPLALAGFHLGIEAAQLAFVALALAAAAALRRLAPALAYGPARQLVVHAIGAAGVALLLDRLWP